jgi:hypothetical protein
VLAALAEVGKREPDLPAPVVEQPCATCHSYSTPLSA